MTPPRFLAVALALALSTASCSTPPAPAAAEADVVLLGEQHDAPEHQRRHLEVVQSLAARGRLAALALEMAEQGAGTGGLPPGADEAGVRAALRWDDAAWPWKAYGPAVMAAVRAGVPVLGANLPRAGMRGAMAEAALDGLLDAPALAAQREAIRAGHCGLLPQAQIAPMARIQIARDRAMAGTVAGAHVAGRTVVLLAGAGHVDPALGVPRHLPATLRVQAVRHPPDASGAAKDYCAELRQQLKPAAPR